MSINNEQIERKKHGLKILLNCNMMKMNLLVVIATSGEH